MEQNQKETIERLNVALNTLNEVREHELGTSWWNAEEGSEIDEVTSKLYSALQDAYDEIGEIVDRLTELAE